MARIVLADDGIEFDGRTPEVKALGGVESSVCFLVRELAARGERGLALDPHQDAPGQAAGPARLSHGSHPRRGPPPVRRAGR